MEDPEYAVTQLAQTTMRSELGKLSLDRVFRVSWGGGYWSCQYLTASQNPAGLIHVKPKCLLLRGLLASVALSLFVDPWRCVLLQ